MTIKKYIPKPVWKQVWKVLSFLRAKQYIVVGMLHPAAIYHCPCCNVHLRSFRPGNYVNNTAFFNPERYRGVMQEVQCPVCGSISRHRILAVWLTKHLDELKGKSILYFAQELGMKKWCKRNHIQVTTADLFAPADLKLDLCSIQQPDDSWDWIVCNHVLEHVENYQTALHELCRILKPGGTLIISFPILSSLPTVIEETEHTEENKKKRLQLYGQADHLRIFGADSREILEKAGFRVSVINGDKMPKQILPVTGPADYDVNYLFVCRKPLS